MEWVGKPVTTQVYLTATVMNLNKLAATRLIVDAFLAAAKRLTERPRIMDSMATSSNRHQQADDPFSPTA